MKQVIRLFAVWALWMAFFITGVFSGWWWVQAKHECETNILCAPFRGIFK